MFKWLYIIAMTLLLVSCSNKTPATKAPTTLVVAPSASSSADLPDSPADIVDKVEWVKLTDDPLITSQMSGKFVFMFFYVPNCQPCEELEKLLNDDYVAFGLNVTFIPTKIDTYKYTKAYFLYVTPAFNDYPRVNVPAITIVSPSGNAFVMRGVPTKEMLVKIIEKAKELRPNGSQESADISKSLSP